MLPLIIAEELLAVRKALSIVRAVDLASTVAGAVLQEDLKRYNDRIVEDEDLYFFILIAAFHYQTINDFGTPLLSESELFDITNVALQSHTYKNSAIDALNRTSSFITSFAEVLSESPNYDPSSLRNLLQEMNKQIKPDTVYIFLRNKPDLSNMLNYLDDLRYNIDEVKAVIDMIVQNYQRDILSRYHQIIGSNSVFMFDTLISALISAVSRFVPMDAIQYTLPIGTIVPSAALIPVWNSNHFPFKVFVPTTFITRQDVNNTETLILRDQRGWTYDKDAKAWGPLMRADDAKEVSDGNALSTAIVGNALATSTERSATRASKAKQASKTAKNIGKSSTKTIADIVKKKLLK